MKLTQGEHGVGIASGLYPGDACQLAVAIRRRIPTCVFHSFGDRIEYVKPVCDMATQ